VVLRTVLLGCCLSLFLAAGSSGAPKKAVVVQFRSPSGNIGCAFSSGLVAFETPAVRCDIRSRLRPAPRAPATCKLDYGDSIQVFKTGRASLVCHGDTAIDRRSRAIAYGHQFSRDGITCVSRTSGMTCTNLSRHGFFVSREAWKIF
jgi:hypothetical protein